jgi:hypothetical protein
MSEVTFMEIQFSSNIEQTTAIRTPSARASTSAAATEEECSNIRALAR